MPAQDPDVGLAPYVNGTTRRRSLLENESFSLSSVLNTDQKAGLNILTLQVVQ